MLTSVIPLAENNALRLAASAKPTGLPTIPRPATGVAGNGFNLRAAMGLEDDHPRYCTVRVSLFFYILILSCSNYTQRCVRSLADRAGMDYTLPWHSQPKETVGKIIGAVSFLPLHFFIYLLNTDMFQARERHHFLHQFPQAWPVEEFLKVYLKNKRTYARKQGYLKESNQKQDISRSNDEEEEDEDEDAENSREEEGNGLDQGFSADEDEGEDMYAQV